MTVCFSRSPICCDSRKLMKVTGHDVNKTLKHFLNISVFRKIFCLFEGAMLKKKKSPPVESIRTNARQPVC